MAVGNVGALLASYGRHVLMIDMDLEAPGLSRFWSSRLAGNMPEGGTIEFLLAVKEALGCAGADHTPEIELARYTVPVALADHMKPRIGDLGRCDLMPIVQAEDYPKQVDRLGLEMLFRRRAGHDLGRLAHKAIDAFRFSVPVPDYVDLSGQEPAEYDYVLIDSRTGLSEIAGLCTGPLSDKMVILCGLNDQNIDGTKEFLDLVGFHAVPGEVPRKTEPGESPAATPRFEASAHEAAPTRKEAIVVASPVPVGDIQLRNDRLAELAGRLGQRHVSWITYHPLAALGEPLFVQDFPEEHIAGEYRKLLLHIQAMVDDTPAGLADRSRKAWNERDDRIAAARDLLRLAPQEPVLGSSLMAQLANVFTPHGADEAEMKAQLARRISQAGFETPEVAEHWGNALLEWARGTEDAGLRDRRFEEGCSHYARAVEIKPDMHEAFSNWGSALTEWAKRAKDAALRDRRFEEGCSHYARAVEIKPDMHEAFSNWGNALTEWAKRTKGVALRDRRFEEACAEYARAVEINPDDAVPRANWSEMCRYWAETFTDLRRREELLTQSLRSADRALELEPESATAMALKAATLVALRPGEAGEEVAALLRRVHELDPEVTAGAPGSVPRYLAAVADHPGVRGALQAMQQPSQARVFGKTLDELVGEPGPYSPSRATGEE